MVTIPSSVFCNWFSDYNIKIDGTSLKRVYMSLVNSVQITTADFYFKVVLQQNTLHGTMEEQNRNL